MYVTHLIFAEMSDHTSKLRSLLTLLTYFHVGSFVLRRRSETLGILRPVQLSRTTPIYLVPRNTNLLALFD